MEGGGACVEEGAGVGVERMTGGAAVGAERIVLGAEKGTVGMIEAGALGGMSTGAAWAGAGTWSICRGANGSGLE